MAGYKSGRGLRIGILGGSFNPAHDGHLHISREALKRLNLDRVWWMVSPQNPLKSSDDMAPLAQRMETARLQAKHPRIDVTDIETRLGSTFTADSLLKLSLRYPRHRFVWLMGADNLIQIPHWKDWNKIFMRVPIAIFGRPSYDSKALFGKAAIRYRSSRVSERDVAGLVDCTPPAWAFLAIRRHAASATAIRHSGRKGVVNHSDP